jgi:hypothetical protein
MFKPEKTQTKPIKNLGFVWAWSGLCLSYVWAWSAFDYKKDSTGLPGPFKEAGECHKPFKCI